MKLCMRLIFLIDSFYIWSAEIPSSKAPTAICGTHLWIPPWCFDLGSQLPVSVEVCLHMSRERREENLQDLASGYLQWSLCSTFVPLNSNWPEAKQSSQMQCWSWAKSSNPNHGKVLTEVWEFHLMKNFSVSPALF